MLAKIKNLALDILFPPLCLACDKYLSDSSDQICLDCLASMPLFSHISCPVCLARITDYGNRCHKDSPYLLAAATDYSHPVAQKLIWQFKYGGWQSLAGIISGFFPLSSIPVENKANWFVVPLPLHSSRKKRRGFNQAELLAEKAARKLNLACIIDNLVRVKHTSVQADLKNYKEREENVRNAFFVENPEQFKGKNIILVDDVFTSGATLGEAARVLKLVGVKRIVALVFARAR